MKRIFITGNAGSGKTTLGRQLAIILNMELSGLDKIVWKPGWKVTPSSERSEKISSLIKREKWVIDGVSRDVLEAADTIIFLDFSRRVSYWRILKRNWKYLFWSRPELPNHCPEILIINRLTKIVWDFPSKIRPFILKYMKENENIKNVFHIRSNNDLKKLIDLISCSTRILESHAAIGN